MKVELIDHTADPERTISKAAAICYDGDTSPEACDRRLTTKLSRPARPPSLNKTTTADALGRLERLVRLF